MTDTVVRWLQLALALWAMGEWLQTMIHRRDTDPLRWLISGGALFCWIAGDVIRLAPTLAGHRVQPAGVASALLNVLWGLLAAGICWRLASEQSPAARPRFWLDSLMITTGLLVVCWPTVLRSTLHQTAQAVQAAGGHWQLHTAMFAHSFADLLVVASVLLLCARLPLLRSRTLLLLIVGQSSLALGDFLTVANHGVPQTAQLPAESCWAIGMAALALAGRRLRRTFLLGSQPATIPSERPVSRVNLAVPYLPLVAVLVFCGIRASANTRWTPIETWLAIVTVVAVVGRQTLVLFENRQLLLAIREREERLSHRAFHDPLTNVANRLLFGERLEAAVADRLTTGCEVAVLFCDLDDFKRINDHLGHTAGDRLLQVAAQRLQECAPEGALVARLGGDEFALLLTGAPLDLSPERVAIEVMARFTEPVVLDDEPLQVVASIGIATSPGGRPCTAEDLLSQADLAMLTAKSRGKGRYATFDAAMKPADLRDRRLVNDLAAALRDGLLHIVYQPIVELSSGRVVGLEALARWDDPRRGPIPPDRFIPLAEATGLIGALTNHVLRRVADDYASWRREGVEVPFISVNVSPTELLRHDFTAAITSALATKMPPSSLVLELTEGHAVPDGPAVEALLHQLRNSGVRIALDDFGAGHHVLANLRRLPLDFIKLDRAIITGAMDSARDEALLGVYVDIGRALNVPVVAEGVETAEQAAHLRQLGCGLGQGYLFSRPMPAGQVPKQLSRRAAPVALTSPRAPAEIESARQELGVAGGDHAPDAVAPVHG